MSLYAGQIVLKSRTWCPGFFEWRRPLRNFARGLRILNRTYLSKRTPFNITCAKKGDTAYIGIKGYISNWTSASSTDIEVAIKDYKAKGATKAELYINSQGGDVFQAEEIKNLLVDNFGKENVKVKIGALAASAATIFCCAFHTTAKMNSQFMIHKPTTDARGTEDDIENTLKLIKDVTARYRKAYAKKMGITEKQVEAVFAKGDYWMTSEEAKKEGLINEIEDEEEKIDAESHLQLVAAAAPHIPKPQNPINTDIEMNLSEIAISMGLPSSASQAQVDERIKALRKSETDLEALKTSNAEKEKQDRATKVKALLDEAEKSKKITGDQRGDYQKLAEANYDSCKAILDKMPEVGAISEQLDPKGAVAMKGQEKWTFEDYQKNPQAWEELEKRDPKKAGELIEAHYKEG